ncbi:MAG: hypothetical protein WAT53_04975 [Nitrosomonas sp.]
MKIQKQWNRQAILPGGEPAWIFRNTLQFPARITVISSSLLFFYAFALIFVIVMLPLLRQTGSIKLLYSINYQQFCVLHLLVATEVSPGRAGVSHVFFLMST